MEKVTKHRLSATPGVVIFGTTFIPNGSPTVSATTHHPLINCQVHRPSLAAGPAAVAQNVAATLRLWRARYQERHGFPLIDDRALRDMGLSRGDVEQELAKPFWKG